MSQSRLEQLAPLTGVVSVVLMLVAALLVNNYSYLPSSTEVSELFDNATRLQIAGYLGVVSSFFLIWFSGSVRADLRPAEGGTGRLSAVAFGGGVAAGGAVVIAFSGLTAAAARAGTEGGIAVDVVTSLFDFYGTLFGVAIPVLFAALIGASGLVALRTGAWPRWLGWASLLLALGSISPISYIFIGFDLLWVAVVSVWLYVARRTRVAA